METSVTASSARVGLLLLFLATLAWTAQAQNANLATLGADLGPVRIQDLTCTCSNSGKFTSMTLRYEGGASGTVTIDGTGHTGSAFGDSFTFLPSGTTISVTTPTGSATVPANGGATSGLLRSLHASLRVTAYTCAGAGGTTCELEADVSCTAANATPSDPTPGTEVTFSSTFKNDHSGITFPGNVTNGTMTVSFDADVWDVTGTGTLPAGVTLTSETSSSLVYNFGVLNDGSPITIPDIKLTVEDPPSSTSSTVTFTIAGDLPDPDGSLDSCPVPFSNLPVELVSFDAQVDGRGATLRWETASETNNAGFEVQHRYASGTDKNASEFEALGWIEGAGTTLEAQSYSYRINDLDPGRHVFRLKQLDFDGTFEYSPQVEVAVEMPEAFLVSNIYPNPFNPEASFSFGVKQSQQVSVELFNMLGQRVRQLYQGAPVAGVTQTIRIDGSGLQSGMYLLRVLGERFVDTQMITLIK